jgi:hypothetical protein
VRFVSPPSEWRQALQKRDAGNLTTIPANLIESFVPQRTERDRISVFRLDEDFPELRLAAAWFLKSKDESTMLSIDEAILVDAGFAFDESEGKTDYAEVNVLHRNILMPSGKDVWKLAELYFLHGELRDVAHQDVRVQVANDNHEGIVDLHAMAKNPKGHFSNKLCDIVGHRAVELTPQQPK